ncbi:hypothetical protein DFH08DRAFT_852228 [Mycena albidolilacea]|uniref:Uncharacterized protein n=1 Tax=Mycena albidolilacea TaxID=1033008 RepID=A0AAD7AE35_9AGAR|nr:hypothetical protein DFH08DRAFT_852228 [Mycena albidolilacea]
MASRPTCNFQASSRVADVANGEAPSAVHQSVLAGTCGASYIRIGRVESFGIAPRDCPRSPADDDIHRIITRVEHPDGTVAATFNRRLDILFGEDTRSSDGRLKNILWGIMGWDSIHWESAVIPFDLTEPKLTRVADELEYLCANDSDKRPAKSGKSSAKTKANESSAGTDANSRPSFTKEPGYEKTMDRERALFDIVELF